MTAENNHSSRINWHDKWIASQEPRSDFCQCPDSTRCLVTNHGKPIGVFNRNGSMVQLCSECDLPDDLPLYSFEGEGTE